MAVIKAVNSKASIGKAINYVTKEEKTEERLVSGKDCNPMTAIDEMKATKEQWGKTEGRQYAHLVQSFNPKDKVTPKQAHEIGRKFIESNEKFKGHEVVIATHIDKGHVHNHFIINSVNFENGKKLHATKKELQQLKERSNELSRKHGLSVPTRGDTITTFDQKKYRAIEKGVKGQDKSYLFDTARNVSQSLKKATDRERFIKDMESKGYKVNWKDTRKHVTFTTPEGEKVRNSNLEKTFKEHKFSKEGMENEIQRNNRERGRTRTTEGIKTERVDWSAVRSNVKGQGNRISKLISNDVIGAIQQQVRTVKARADRATKQDKQEDRATATIKRDTNTESKHFDKECKQKLRERSFNFER